MGIGLTVLIMGKKVCGRAILMLSEEHIGAGRTLLQFPTTFITTDDVFESESTRAEFARTTGKTAWEI